MILRLATHTFEVIPRWGYHGFEGLFIEEPPVLANDIQTSGEIVRVPDEGNLYRVRVGQSVFTVQGVSWSIEAPDIRYKYRRWFRVTHPGGMSAVIYSDEHYPTVNERLIPDAPVFREGSWRIPGLRGKWYTDELEARDVIHYFKFAQGYSLEPHHSIPFQDPGGDRRNQWEHLLQGD